MNNKKDLYIENSLIGKYCGNTLFEDVYIEHNSLPEINFDEIDTKTVFMGEEFSFPLIMSSMLGGTEKTSEINEALVILAKEFNLPLEVGSQQEFIYDDIQSKLFITNIEDDLLNDVFLISNMSAKAKLSEIEKSITDINASGVSIYLNAAQEVVSFDGNPNFRNVLSNISKIAEKYRDILLVKEKAMGMSKQTIQSLVSAGVKYIDISGFGGTNFMEIENLRNYRNDFSALYPWGIPTAKSILNARNIEGDFKIIASGGVYTAIDIVKALIIGADYVGIAGELLKYYLHGGYYQAKKYLESLIRDTKILMFLLGVKNLSELKTVDYKITGKLKEIL